MRSLILLVSLIASLWAVETGELSLYVMKDGTPLADQEVVIFKKSLQQTANVKGYTTKQVEFKTDNDGYIFAVLPVGSYQAQIIAIEGGKPLAFVKKNFVIENKKESQFIISLKKDNSVQFEDSETPSATVKAVDTNTSANEKGTVQINLRSSEDQTLIKNARIFVQGMNVDVITDEKGNASLSIPEGEHTISIIHSSFSAQTLKIKVIANETATQSFEMTPASMELEEFIVLAPHIEGSVSSVIAQERNSNAVGNVLGSEQFSKSGDSNAAAALKRVSGITIVGGKYVYVRGLGDRYTTILLNDLHVPSPEPTKRVVPLDTFPTSVIKSIEIQKSYTADLPGSFAGGTVKIESTGIPEGEGFVNASITRYQNNSTGKKAITNDQNNVRIPDNVIAATDKFQVIGGQPFTRDVLNSRSLNHQSTTLEPGMKFELSAGKSFDVTKDISIGVSGTVFYKHTEDIDDIDYDKYLYNINTDEIDLESQVAAEVTTIDTQFGGMLNLGANYYGNNNIKYTMFSSNDYKNQTTYSQTTFVGTAEDKDKTYYEYTEKGLLINQISGSNELLFGGGRDGYFDNLIIDWAGEIAEATRYEPGTVEYTYLHQTSGINWSQKNWYYYFDLTDEVTNYRVDLTLPFRYNGNDNYTKFGAFIYDKERTFDGRRFKLSDKAASSTGIDLTSDMDSIYVNAASGDMDFESAYRVDDSYTATQTVSAVYAKQLLSITPDLDLTVSLRSEQSMQQLKNPLTGIAYDPLETNDMLPGLGLTYRLNNDMQMRAGYSATISRPDFREFSPNRYLDPVTENIVFGNPDLKATYINNFDVKYEWYMASDELFSVALFGKQFTDPIETVVKVNAADGNTLEQTYRNADSATSYGVEFDLRKRFTFFGDAFENLLFATNVALINSQITLKDDPTDPFVSGLTTKERAMQGQSPYVVNMQLGYDNPNTGDSALFLFNQIGERIVLLGTDNNEDQYQDPFAKLDFVTRWKLNNYYFKDSDFSYSIKFKAENLLDSEQTISQGGITTYSTKPGREFSFSLKIAY